MAKQNKETIGEAQAQVSVPAADSADKYSKEQILASDAYANRRDLLNVLLEDGRQYTNAEVEKIMGDWFRKGVE